jgi:hypothetical protein
LFYFKTCQKDNTVIEKKSFFYLTFLNVAAGALIFRRLLLQLLLLPTTRPSRPGRDKLRENSAPPAITES